MSQREQILNLVLKDENIEASTDLNELSIQTEGFSGSDLKELCRTAAVCRLKDHMPK